ncbi:hypothetical protein ACFXPW_31000 [Streptomyces goshikiensis]
MANGDGDCTDVTFVLPVASPPGPVSVVGDFNSERLVTVVPYCARCGL